MAAHIDYVITAKSCCLHIERLSQFGTIDIVKVDVINGVNQHIHTHYLDNIFSSTSCSTSTGDK